MVDTRRSPPADGAVDAVRAAIAQLLAQAIPEGGPIGVALSGGRDSITLLDAAASVAQDARCNVIALHIDHGLSTHAGAWATFCRDASAARGVAFAMREVSVPRSAASGVEAAARAARYDALAALAREHRLAALLLAHHADDQAETTLLQLLRGAGPRGLSAMPVARFAGTWWLRPLLALPRETIDAYMAKRALRHVDDDSNGERRFRRNALRETVVPALRAMAPGYPGVLVRAAGHQAEAAALLDDLAAIDARSSWDGVTLDCASLRALDAPRARNLLRWFLRQRGLPAPSSARLADMLRQLTSVGGDAQIRIRHGGRELGVHRGRLVVHRHGLERYACQWNGARAVVLPHGTLLFDAVNEGGIAARHLCASRVTIRAGVPGERLRVAGRASRRHVADLLREAGVPAWQRLGLPRVYCDGALAAVACAGVDDSFAAAPGEPAFALQWRPADG